MPTSSNCCQDTLSNQIRYRQLGIALSFAATAWLSPARAQQPVSLRETWRITSETGDSILFDDITDFDVDKRGNVYVLDAKRPRIVVIDSAGHVVRTFGRKGAGPAELGHPTGIAVAPDGAIWLQDPANGRTIVLDAAGGHKAVFPGRPFAIRTPWPAVFLDDGDITDMASGRTPNNLDAYGSIVRKYANGNTLVVRDSLDLGSEPKRIILAATDRSTVVPFSPRLQLGVAPQGFLWIANTAEFRLRKVSFAGKELAVVSRSANNMPVSAAQRESGAKMVSQVLGKPVSVDEIPKVHPAIASMFVSRNGEVWVQRSNATMGTTSTFERFDMNGKQLATVTIPIAVDAAIMSSNYVICLTRTQDGLPVLLRYRLP